MLSQHFGVKVLLIYLGHSDIEIVCNLKHEHLQGHDLDKWIVKCSSVIGQVFFIFSVCICMSLSLSFSLSLCVCVCVCVHVCGCMCVCVRVRMCVCVTV